MAIAFDAVTNGGTFNASWSHTITGASPALVVAAFDDNGGSNLLTAVTWNGSESLTKACQVQVPGDRWISLWYLLNPTTGTHTVALTTTAGAYAGESLSYTGVGSFDASVTATGSSVTSIGDTFTVGTNAWIITAIKENSGRSSGQTSWTNATDRSDGGGNGLHAADSNGPLTGSQTTSAAISGGSFNAAIASISLLPVGGGGGGGTVASRRLVLQAVNRSNTY